MALSICPPFTLETAITKVRAAEDAWNSRDPETVSRAYSENSRWRNRAESKAVAQSLNFCSGNGRVNWTTA
jgi:nuclear transport factor 2 (NTF2) superfamily protein